MARPATSDMPSKYRARIVLLVLSLLLLYVVLPRLDDFAASWPVLRNASPGMVLVASLFVVLTYAFAGAIYTLLAIHRLHLGRTVAIQVASAFTNRLLPAGIGGLTINVEYLHRARHTLPQALTVAGANNGIGLLGHGILLAGAVVFSHGALVDRLHIRIGMWSWVLTGCILLAIVVLNVFAFRRVREYLHRLTLGVVRNVLAYRNRPGRLALALACSLALTSCYVLVLQFSALAVGVQLSVWSMFVVFTAGIVAGTATPTPGGLGGAEAGLVAGLVAYGVDASAALATVLLYRLLTYWLPLLPGVATFFAIRKRYL